VKRNWSIRVFLNTTFLALLGKVLSIQAYHLENRGPIIAVPIMAYLPMLEKSRTGVAVAQIEAEAVLALYL